MRNPILLLGVGGLGSRLAPRIANELGCACSIVTDGTEQNQSILTVETTGALTAEETIDAAIQRLNSKVKGFTDAVTSLQVPGTT